MGSQRTATGISSDVHYDDRHLLEQLKSESIKFHNRHGRTIMDIKIVRGKSTPEGTTGELTTDAGFSCQTLELQWADNQRGVSCIKPAPGDDPETYTATIWHSPTLGRDVVRLEDKYGRVDCLLHNGNFAGEGKGEVTQVHGCTEVGRGYGQITQPVDKAVTQFGILHSVATIDALVAHIKEQVGDQPFT